MYILKEKKICEQSLANFGKKAFQYMTRESNAWLYEYSSLTFLFQNIIATIVFGYFGEITAI